MKIIDVGASTNVVYDNIMRLVELRISVHSQNYIYLSTSKLHTKDGQLESHGLTRRKGHSYGLRIFQKLSGLKECTHFTHINS
jgi:hypothetical protein